MDTETHAKGQKVGYVRVSSFDQNPERQLEGVPLARIFTDKASGKDVHRPELENLLAFIREGDTVVVHSMDRLARNLDDLRQIVQRLTKRGILARPATIPRARVAETGQKRFPII
jgi:DNA invertase Pin-like site-specific DNA recombinase